MKAIRWWVWCEYALVVLLLIPFSMLTRMPILLWWTWGRAHRHWQNGWLFFAALLMGWQLDILHHTPLGVGTLFLGAPSLLWMSSRLLHKHWQREVIAGAGFVFWLAFFVWWWQWPMSLWWQQIGWAVVGELIILWRKYAYVQK